MPYIIVFRSDEKIMEYQARESAPLRIGRSQENDIVIADSAVSSQHAEIEYDNGTFYITDFQSRNGTFVNRELVISRPLAHDDIISIGSYHLKFIYKKDEKTPPSSRSTSKQDATMHIDTPRHRSRLARSVAELAERESRTSIRGMISFLKGDAKPLFLDKPIVTIGKDPDADIVAKGWFVAKNAAEIRKKDDGYYLAPTGSKPPLVNAAPVRSEVLLREFDMIQVGSTAMQLLYHRGGRLGSEKKS